jgi:integrase
VLSSLKSLLKHAQGEGNVAQNVALAVKRIEPDKRSERELKAGVDMPSPEEIKLLIAKMPDRWRPLLVTAIFTGLRASELRGLRWVSVDFTHGTLEVNQRADRYQQIGSPKSKAGHRTVPIPPLVLNTLREWKLRCPRGELGLVFPNQYGGVARHNKIVAQFRRIVVKAGLVDAQGAPKYTGLHSLRHFYASWCINPVERGGQGLPPKVVQERLGHSSIVMTMNVYGHLFAEDKKADQKLADAERALWG